MRRRRNTDFYVGEDGAVHPIRSSEGYDSGYDDYRSSGQNYWQEMEAGHTKKSAARYDDTFAMPPLDKFVRQLGGIKPKGAFVGEINRLRNRESGSSGLVRADGVTLHAAQEAAAEAGYIPWSYTDAEFLEELERVLQKRNPMKKKATKKKRAAKRKAATARPARKVASKRRATKKNAPAVKRAAKKATKRNASKKGAKPKAGERGHQPRMWIDGGKIAGKPQLSFQEIFEKDEAKKQKGLFENPRKRRKPAKKKTVKRNPKASLKIGPLKLSAGVSWNEKKNPAKRKPAKKKAAKRNRSNFRLVHVKDLKEVSKGGIPGYRFAGKFYRKQPGREVALRRGYKLMLSSGSVWRREYYENNPTKKRATSKAKPGATFAKFTGKPSRKENTLTAANGTPKQLDKLGALVLLKTDKGYTLGPGAKVWLCADRKGKLHLATSAAAMTDLPKGSLGRVKRIEYSATKAHLDGKPTVYYHNFGEVDGRRPELLSDGRGGIIFRGGAYRITAAGIVN